MQVSIPHELAQGARWYLVHTRPNSERKAELNLQAQGFATFLPQIEKTIRHARRLKTVRRPLFPRYLFVRRRLLKMCTRRRGIQRNGAMASSAVPLMELADGNAC